MCNSKTVARILDKAAAQSFVVEIDNIIPILDEARNTCFELNLTKEEILEVERRVAEWKLKLFCDRSANISVTAPLRTAMLAKGYSSLENEVNTELYYVQYCIDISNHKQAIEILKNLHKKTANAVETKGSSDLLESINDMTTKVRSV